MPPDENRIGPMIKPGSPLLGLPGGLPPNQVKILDAIRLSAQWIDGCYLRLEALLESFGTHRGPTPHGSAALALADAWSVVDAVHRLRLLVSEFPGYKRRAPSKVLFLQRTEAVEPLRNTVQHLTGELARIVADDLPILGALTWLRVVDRARTLFDLHTLVPGQFRPTRSGANVHLPPSLGADIDHVTLWATGGHVDLTVVHRAVNALIATLESPVAELRKQGPATRCDAHIVIKMSYEADASEEST